MTKVSPKCAWEYCVYIGDNDFGLYNQNGNKVAKPFGMSAEKVYGDSGQIKVKIAKSLLNNVPAIRYTITTTDPQEPHNPDPFWQGGSSASDVFPGTPATFGGEINGYCQISTEGILAVTEYTIFYVYDGIDPIVEYPASGSPLASYINAGGMHIGKIAGADSSWYHCDALGTPRKMTDELGVTVTWSGSYYPFGEATISGTRANTHQFTGKEMDSEMGLNYFCQRYYDPQIGRFMSLDPQDSPASSPYAYCANNPLRFTDPTGEKFSALEEYERGWALRDRAMWEAGFQDICFFNYDEWSNLTGIDYYSPNSTNNPYLEDYIIPPTIYFAVYYTINNNVPKGEEGKPLSTNEMTALMQIIYDAAMYGGIKGRLAVSGFIGKSVFNKNLGNGVTGHTFGNCIAFNMGIINSIAEFSRVIYHEGLHGGPEKNIYNHNKGAIYINYKRPLTFDEALLYDPRSPDLFFGTYCYVSA